MDKDRERTQILESNGLQVIRFSNNEITEDLDKIILKINQKIDEILVSQNSNQ